MIRRSAITVSCLLLGAAFVGCGDDFPIEPDPPVLEIAPLFTGVLEGDTVRLAATLGGQTATVTWDAEHDSIATVSADGLVTAILPGFTAVTATASGGQRSASVTVNAVTALKSDSAVTLSGSGAAGSRTFRKIAVPTGKTSLAVTLTPAATDTSGNADLYVRRGRLPSTTVNDCASTNPKAVAESCTINNPAAGTWYILLVLRTPYSNATLRATVSP